jgi:hypothetical protein
MATRKKTAAPKVGYDDSNAKKTGVGVYVFWSLNGQDVLKFLFAEGQSSYKWRKIAGQMCLEVTECGEVALQMPQQYVVAVGTNLIFFRDTEWK